MAGRRLPRYWRLRRAILKSSGRTSTRNARRMFETAEVALPSAVASGFSFTNRGVEGGWSQQCINAHCGWPIEELKGGGSKCKE
jgi:hypothetical protein